MKKALLIHIMATTVLLSSCSKATNSWKNPQLNYAGKTYHSVLITALTQDRGLRTVVENDIAAAAAQKGYKMIKSADVFSSLQGRAIPDQQFILSRARELGCDAILTVAPIDKSTESRYIPQNNRYTPYPTYDYYGSFGRYYTRWYGPLYDPNYYTTGKNYYLESNLFDASTQDILWSTQSKVYNLSDLSSYSRTFSLAMIKQMERDRVLAAH